MGLGSGRWRWSKAGVRDQGSGIRYERADWAAQTDEAVHHLRFADAAKLAAEHFRKLGLREAENFGGLLLAPFALAENLLYLRHQLRFHEHFIGVWKA
jgi:hypothetical protein